MLCIMVIWVLPLSYRSITYTHTWYICTAHTHLLVYTVYSYNSTYTQYILYITAHYLILHHNAMSYCHNIYNYVCTYMGVIPRYILLMNHSYCESLAFQQISVRVRLMRCGTYPGPIPCMVVQMYRTAPVMRDQVTSCIDTSSSRPVFPLILF